MWSPAVTAVRSKGIACTYQPLKEGYRAWAAGFGLPKHVTGKKLDCGLRVHQLVPVRLGRRLPQPPGLLLGRARHRQGQHDAPTSGASGWKASRPTSDIKAPDGKVLEKAGAVRDGGSYDDAHGRRRLLERRDGRERLHGPQVERVHRRLMTSHGLCQRRGARRVLLRRRHAIGLSMRAARPQVLRRRGSRPRR